MTINDEQKVAIMQHFIHGGAIQVKSKHDGSNGRWIRAYEPSWNWAHFMYRVALTELSFDWSVLKPEYKYAAVDGDGEAYAYIEEPEPIGHNDMWHSDYRKPPVFINGLVSYNRGDMPWYHSLIKRPEGV